MKYIAHRGNLNGPNPADENKPEYILKAIQLGFECEIDVRYIHGGWFLGHDTPDYKIDLDFLLDNSENFWIHCKNIEALNELIQYSQLNIFWHQNDDYTLTSKHFIWCYPGKTILPGNSITVMPEWNHFYVSGQCYGVCSDYVADEVRSCLKIQNKQK
jgi:hypothetical protein